jgi:hypothetical protein
MFEVLWEYSEFLIAIPLVLPGVFGSGPIFCGVQIVGHLGVGRLVMSRLKPYVWTEECLVSAEPPPKANPRGGQPATEFGRD